jgi:hypothetical protein
MTIAEQLRSTPAGLAGLPTSKGIDEYLTTHYTLISR